VPLVQKKQLLGCYPIQCFANLAPSQFANDQQRFNFNNSIATVAQNNMNVWRRMITKIHQDTAIGKSLHSRHKREYRATIAPACS